MLRTLLVGGLLVGTISCTTVSQAKPEPKKEPVLHQPGLRLPEGARPTRQSVELSVVPGVQTVAGSTSIDIELTVPGDVIWLNASALEIHSTEITIGGRHVAAQAKLYPPHHLAIVSSETLPAGALHLQLTFEANISRKSARGLFELSLAETPYVFSQFEEHDARKAFPCFDEPSFKIPMQLTLHVKKAHFTASNTPIESERDEANEMKSVTFAPTKPIPTYLFAFIVGPFEVLEAGQWGRNKVPVRVIVPRGQSAQAAWALANVGQLLQKLEAWFDLPYPYEKMDHVAMPGSTGFAMENAGLITYQSEMLILKPEDDELDWERRRTSTVAHELAHQWFGDLVTLEWWDDTWLNESFASWMEVKMTDIYRPEWKMDVDRVKERNRAAGLDQLASARKVRQPILTDDDIAGAFDQITYLKGSAVISMFEAWLGPEVFQRGVRDYLKAHAFNNATAADFMASISHAAGRDVAPVFLSFLDQPGVPSVSFTLRCEAGKKPTVSLAQVRSLPIGSSAEASSNWQIPICMRWNDGRACTLLTKPEATIELDTQSCPTWLFPNDAMTGYYRSKVTDSAGLLRTGRLSTSEKVGFLSDVGALVKSGLVDISASLEMVPQLVQSNEAEMIEAAMRAVPSKSNKFYRPQVRPKYERFVRENFGPALKKVGLSVNEKDSAEVRLLRPALIEMVADSGNDPELRKKCVELGKRWLADKTAIHPDLVSVVMDIAGEAGDTAFHNQLLELAKKTDDRTQRSVLLSALASSKDPELVRTQLQVLLDPNLDIRNWRWLLRGAVGHVETRQVAFAFLKAHWDELLQLLPEDAGANAVGLAAVVCTPEERDDLKAFFAGRSTKYRGGPLEFAQAFERVDLCIAFNRRHQADANAYFDTWKPAGAPSMPRTPKR